MIDCHTHSNFSGDSEMDAVAACEAAKKLGLDGICFTDHLDIDFPDFDIEFNIDFDQYAAYMQKLKFDYYPDFKVLMGLEAGIQRHVIKETDDIVMKYDFDYVIGSVHIIDGMDPYKSVFYEGKTKKEAYGRYLEEVNYAVNVFDNFDVVGHLDFIIRYACYDDRTLRYCEHTDLMDSILKTIVSKGKGIEVNTASYRDKEGIVTAEYDIDILKRYKELGGEIICLGSDAHHLDHVGYKFDYFSQLLKEAGFKYITYFKKREPVFDRIP